MSDAERNRTMDKPEPAMSEATPLLPVLQAAVASAARLVQAAQASVRLLVAPDGPASAASLDQHQTASHGYAWMASYLAVLETAVAWAARLEAEGRFGALEQALLAVGAAEYVAQLCHGIAMSQDEIVRPDMLGLQEEAARVLAEASVRELSRRGGSPAARARLSSLLRQQGLHAMTATADADEAVAMVRTTFRAFADDRIVPFAPGWHNHDELMPLDLIQELADLGVFGLTTPEDMGGSGLGSVAMCVVTEELARGYIGAGSLGTRAEIACELIRMAGTPAQRAHYLPRIASGAILTTAVFTEPNTGSDLAHLTTRAERTGDVYRVYGNKTWITHAARADLMLLLVRTDPAERGHRGLTMLLAEKPRGTDADPFPAKGMSGGEIRVLGYRGMREYEIAFDGFEVPATQILGDVEGQGFRQLMATFELARIQTAARALGVGQNALELAHAYATDRVQFGRPIIEFPRVANKLAWMAAELTMLRQLVYAVARKKETGVRCDVEAGMAKLIAARAAWSAADNALQIHGGNGYALEYPISRVLCDARILNIFEGAAEIQAGIIARGLLGRD
jgi:(2S)-methylsuccinyl-CoA dehydrogenase